jgi:23S rRNA (adenine2503-C2)-methyltransferase
MTVAALEGVLGSRARAVRTARWIYGVRPWVDEAPASLAGVNQAAWSALRAATRLPQVAVRARDEAADGTTKLLLALDGGVIETVLIPAATRATVCVSSQVGCTRACRFCATATLGFGRNLRADEIVAQFLIARAGAADPAAVKNVVFMGMGEPMDNLDEVLTAVAVLTQVPAPQLGHAQVTVSTSGVVPGMRRFLGATKASLALSLNGSTDAQRTAVMPHNKTWPIAELMAVLREHPGRVHFIEYVLFDGVNDADADAARVVALVAGMDARVNVIPHNPIGGGPGDGLRAPSKERVMAFHKAVAAGGVRCMVRWPRGQDIAAACGQLARRVSGS